MKSRSPGGPSISVMLAVPDAAAAVEWYKRALGAVELWNLGSVVGMEVEGAPFFLAEDKGYFEEAGVDVELLAKGGTSGETYQLVSTNNVTAGGATWGAGLFNATEAGASLSVIASVSRVPESGPNPAPFVVAADVFEK